MTIVTVRREPLFGKIENGITPYEGNVVLNDFGKIADECWRAISEHFPNVELGAFVIMPNHVHGVIVIGDDESASNGVLAQRVGATHWVAPTTTITRPAGPKRGSLGAIIGSYKMAVTRQIGREHNATGIWQRNYYACPEPVEGKESSATSPLPASPKYDEPPVVFGGGARQGGGGGDTSKPTPPNGTMTTKTHRTIGGKIHTNGQRAST